MKYFRIRQDFRDSPKFLIDKLHTLKNANSLLRGDLSSLDKTVMLESYYPYSEYPNISSEQIFMVKKDLFEVLMLFEPNLDYKSAFITDFDNHLDFLYIPNLPKIKCFSERSTYNLDKSVFKNIVIQKSNYPNIFRIDDIKDKIIIISLPLAEALLRRGIKHFYLELIDVE